MQTPLESSKSSSVRLDPIEKSKTKILSKSQSDVIKKTPNTISQKPIAKVPVELLQKPLTAHTGAHAKSSRVVGKKRDIVRESRSQGTFPSDLHM